VPSDFQAPRGILIFDHPRLPATNKRFHRAFCLALNAPARMARSPGLRAAVECEHGMLDRKMLPLGAEGDGEFCIVLAHEKSICIGRTFTGEARAAVTVAQIAESLNVHSAGSRAFAAWSHAAACVPGAQGEPRRKRPERLVTEFRGEEERTGQ